jgi:hypothetical protein
MSLREIIGLTMPLPRSSRPFAVDVRQRIGRGERQWQS